MSEKDRLWEAFRAGGTAEHARVVAVFTKVTNNGHYVAEAEKASQEVPADA